MNAVLTAPATETKPEFTTLFYRALKMWPSLKRVRQKSFRPTSMFACNYRGGLKTDPVVCVLELPHLKQFGNDFEWFNVQGLGQILHHDWV